MDEIILLRVTISGWHCTSTSETNRRRGAVGSQLDPRSPHAWSADKLQLHNCRGLKWNRQVLSHKDSRGIKLSRFSNWFGIAVVATFKGVIQSPDWGFFFSFHCNLYAASKIWCTHLFIDFHTFVDWCAMVYHHVLLCSVRREIKIDSVLYMRACAVVVCMQPTACVASSKKPETANVTF